MAITQKWKEQNYGVVIANSEAERLRLLKKFDLPPDMHVIRGTPKRDDIVGKYVWGNLDASLAKHAIKVYR